MKCYTNYLKHQRINPTMKKVLFTLFILFISYNYLNAQAVGYQGKKFTVELGYSPVTTLSAKFFDFGLEDAHYTDASSIIIKHVPKVIVEYVVFNRGSIMLRYNPWSFTTNFEYFDEFEFESHIAGAKSKGSMISLGYKSFMTSTPAPLGSYFGINITHYRYSTAYIDSKFDPVSIPKILSSYEPENASTFGIFGSLGFKNIFWDQFTLDVSLEAGLFLGGDDIHFNGDEFGDQYTIASGFAPESNHVRNTNVFYTVVPTVSFGWLAF